MDFPDELWSIIKEFAGVYDIGTKFNISRLGVGKLHDFYEDNFNRKIPNYRKNAHSTKQIIMRSIRFKMNEELWRILYSVCNPIKLPYHLTTTLLGKVGEEIRWWIGHCGIIVGYYKNSYKVKRYYETKTNVQTLSDGSIKTTWIYIKNDFYPKYYNVSKYQSHLYSTDIRLYSNGEEFYEGWNNITGPDCD